jgi:hypothetical protein
MRVQARKTREVPIKVVQIDSQQAALVNLYNCGANEIQALEIFGVISYLSTLEERVQILLHFEGILLQHFHLLCTSVSKIK